MTTTLQDRFQRLNREYTGRVPAVPVLLAVSGGADSMALLHLCRNAGWNIAVAHCNFQLRGAESDGDEAFVRETCREWNVPFYTRRFDTATFAADQGISVQMAARELRYDWFRALAHEQGYTLIATAHQLNDHVETALLHFIRGTGIRGMAGMTPSGVAEKPQQAMAGVIRPLLFATRAEILEYLQEAGIRWREDSSNASDDYKRNYLRHRIMPEMEEINPNFIQTASRNLQRFREATDNLDFLLAQFTGIDPHACVREGASYIIERKWTDVVPAPVHFLQELLGPAGFNADQVRQAAEHRNDTGFELRSEQGWTLVCDRQGIRVLAPESERTRVLHLVEAGDLMTRLPDESSLVMLPSVPLPPYPDGREAVLIDTRDLIFPLTLRHWEPGDSFQPFGLDGSRQKLQDFFTNEKVSRADKDKIWLLVNGDGTPIWVVGYRLDHRFRVTADTRDCLKIMWNAHTS